MANFKYKQLENWILSEIKQQHFVAGSRIPAESELMKQFNISRQTVRLAISHLEEQGVLQRVQGSGTYVSGDPSLSADDLRRTVKPGAAANNTIALVMADTTGYIFPEILNGASDVCTRNGYHLSVVFTDASYDTEQQILQKILAEPPAGLILEPLNFGLLSVNEPLYREVTSRIPTLMIHAQENEIAPVLSLHDREGTEAMTDHLISLGHTRIGTILCANESTGQIRFLGYLDSLRKHGLLRARESDVWYMRSGDEDLFEPAGNLALERMLTNVTAVICMDDRLAFKMIAYLRGKGIRVPEDISVTGYDDSFFSTLSDQITTVEHPKIRYGQRAALALFDLIDKGRVDLTRYEETPRLLLRDTTAPPRVFSSN